MNKKGKNQNRTKARFKKKTNNKNKVACGIKNEPTNRVLFLI